MGDVYIGEIRIFPYSRIPDGWVPCDGRQLPIQQNAALYSLLSTIFGGDGKTYFNVPDLRGRTILGSMGAAQGVPPQVGGKGGSEVVTLTMPQMPAHNHTLRGTSSNGTSANPTNAYLAVSTPPASLQNPPPNPALYGPAPQQTSQMMALHASMIQPQGGSQPHENRQPFMALVCCIATQGYYPQRN